MPFGLKTAHQSYQTTIDKLLLSHQYYAAGYIDNILIFLENWEHHIQHLRKILVEIRNSGMTLKIKEMLFCKAKNSNFRTYFRQQRHISCE